MIQLWETKKSASKTLAKRFGSTDFWLVVNEASHPVELGRRLSPKVGLIPDGVGDYL